MTIDFTVLPDTVDGSLGREKIDPVESVALDYQVPALEWNNAAGWLKHLAAVVGADSTTDEDSLRACVEAIGFGSGRYYRDIQWFLSGPGDAIDSQRWSVDAAGWKTVDIEGGGITAPLDLVAEKLCVEYSFAFRRAHLPWLEFRLRASSVAAGGPEVRVGFGNVARTDGWWITFDPDVAAGAARVESRVGGVAKTADLSTVVAKTWHTFRLWLVESSGSYYPVATMDGGVATSVTTQAIDSKEYQRQIVCGAGATAGETARLSRLVTRADFGA